MSTERHTASPIVEASLAARVRVQRQSQGRRDEARRLRAGIGELRQRLLAKRVALKESDELIAQMQREREATRQECFKLEETILEDLTRAIALTSGNMGLPTFIELDEVRSAATL